MHELMQFHLLFSAYLVNTLPGLPTTGSPTALHLQSSRNLRNFILKRRRQGE